MKKADKLLVLVVLLSCLVLFLMQRYGQGRGDYLTIEVDGEPYQMASLIQNGEIRIGDTNCIVIEDGAAYMAEASCPDQLCLKQGRISKNGQMIVCLPNRVTVGVVGEADADGTVPDAAAR